mmetsp:Transcript_17685/g.43597  ORF Transcript_17685/g.43597 Transcript_17685/m.43597 type:complete len:268 (+) Transcript_17685:159-962(+)
MVRWVLPLNASLANVVLDLLFTCLTGLGAWSCQSLYYRILEFKATRKGGVLVKDLEPDIGPSGATERITSKSLTGLYVGAFFVASWWLAAHPIADALLKFEPVRECNQVSAVYDYSASSSSSSSSSDVPCIPTVLQEPQVLERGVEVIDRRGSSTLLSADLGEELKSTIAVAQDVAGGFGSPVSGAVMGLSELEYTESPCENWHLLGPRRPSKKQKRNKAWGVCGRRRKRRTRRTRQNRAIQILLAILIITNPSLICAMMKEPRIVR